MERDAPKGAINSLDMTDDAPDTDNRFSSAVSDSDNNFRGGGGMNNRLAAARGSVVDGALDRADDLDDEVVAQRAGEIAASDEVLVGLCRVEDRLEEIEATHDVDGAVDPVDSSMIAAGIKLEDSILRRIEQLASKVVDDLRAEMLEGGLEP